MVVANDAAVKRPGCALEFRVGAEAHRAAIRLNSGGLHLPAVDGDGSLVARRDALEGGRSADGLAKRGLVGVEHRERLHALGRPVDGAEERDPHTGQRDVGRECDRVAVALPSDRRDAAGVYDRRARLVGRQALDRGLESYFALERRRAAGVDRQRQLRCCFERGSEVVDHPAAAF